MKIIYQRQPKGSNICGQACIAMLANISLEESIKIFGTRGKTSTKDIINALNKLDILCSQKLIRIRKNESKSNLCIVTNYTVINGKKYKHWVIYYKNKYYDPAIGVFSCDSYQQFNKVETSYLPIFIHIS